MFRSLILASPLRFLKADSNFSLNELNMVALLSKHSKKN
jgi:hypothetical protein